MSTIGEIDAQIRATIVRRDEARGRLSVVLDGLFGALVDVESQEQQIEDLLRQRNEAGTS